MNRVWARVRRRGENSLLIEGETVREVWYKAYSLSRCLVKNSNKAVTFRVNVDRHYHTQYARLYLEMEQGTLKIQYAY